MKRKKNVARYVRMTARQLRAASRLRQRNGRDEVPPPDSRGARLVGENPPTAGAPAPRTRRQSHLREPYQELLAKSDVLARKFGISRALLIERSNAVSKLYWRLKGACKRFGHRTKQYKSASGEPRARGSGQLVGFPRRTRISRFFYEFQNTAWASAPWVMMSYSPKNCSEASRNVFSVLISPLRTFPRSCRYQSSAILLGFREALFFI
jgi:hypothetical protein